MEISRSACHKSASSNTSMIEESVLLEESLDFSSPQHFSDVVLVVEDAKLHAHKSTLSRWSPVFQTMFTSPGQFKESTAKEIPLPGKRADEVRELLKVIYSSWSKPKITEENCQFLLQLADEYQMDRVKKLCSEFLVDKIQVSNCLEYFKLAEAFGLNDVTEKCYQKVCYNSSADLEGSEHFNGFEPEFKVDICMKVIKELERTLKECVGASTDLVMKVYKQVSMRIDGGLDGVSKNLKEHRRRHKLQKRNLQNAQARRSDPFSYGPDTYYNSNLEFKLSCNSCIEEVQQTKWNGSVAYSILKGPLTNLCALLVQYAPRPVFRPDNKRKEHPQ